MQVWILTREINQYDQDGEYFCAVFGCPPTHSELVACGVPVRRIQHVLTNGGGRVDGENEWFFLRQTSVHHPCTTETSLSEDSPSTEKQRENTRAASL